MNTFTDPLHGHSRPRSYWTRTNLAEAVPGVPTPLGWTVWGDSGERVMRGFFHSIGALERRETGLPAASEDRSIGIFYGRACVRVDFYAAMGDRMPGTTGAKLAEQILGTVPADLVSAPARRHYPIVTAKMAAVLTTARRRVIACRASTETWWHEQVTNPSVPPLEECRQLFLKAADRFEHNLLVHTTALNALVQPVYNELSKLTDATAGVGTELMGGYGNHAETEMVTDLWRCSRDEITLDEVLSRHGYHGSLELSGRVWREDPTPLLAIIDGYRRKDDAGDPTTAETTRVDARRHAENAVLRALPAPRRPAARAILALARRQVPLRGTGKVAFSQAFDVCRATARHLGTRLAEQGILRDPEDVFYLTRDEIAASDWHDADRIGFRRERRTTYQQTDLPVSWQGTPTPIAVAAATESDTVTGDGASPGVVEARARVVTDPGADDLEDGEILIASVTDPSWASIMFLASALVTDIGGMLSHTAVVARELGIPCVVGTRHATTTIRTGDLCRVDGTTGHIDILERAGTPPTSTATT